MTQNKTVLDGYKTLASEVIRCATESKSEDAAMFLASAWAELLADFCGATAALEKIRKERGLVCRQTQA